MIVHLWSPGFFARCSGKRAASTTMDLDCVSCAACIRAAVAGAVTLTLTDEQAVAVMRILDYVGALDVFENEDDAEAAIAAREQLRHALRPARKAEPR